MKNSEIKEIIASSFIDSLLKEKEFDLIATAKKNKISIKKVKILFPYNDEINNYELLKIFNNTINDNILMKFYDEIENENISFYEKVLEGFFLRFEVLNKYRKALIALSSSPNKKIKNFIALCNNNHQFMLKFLKICGDNDNSLKISAKAFILNLIYFKNLNLFLSNNNVSMDKIMKNLDRDIKKAFSSNFLFKKN